MSIVNRIKEEIALGTVIHNQWKMKGCGIRRGKDALIYTMPGGRERDREKGINESEWNRAYNELMTTGCFRRSWFEKNMEDCNREGGCNFKAIGGVFSIMGIARYGGKGAYLKTTQLS